MYVEPLTPRERQCLLAAAEDKTMRDTAKALCISIATVKSHRAMVLQKLGCRTIAGALMAAIRFGLLADKLAKNSE